MYDFNHILGLLGLNTPAFCRTITAGHEKGGNSAALLRNISGHFTLFFFLFPSTFTAHRFCSKAC